METRSFLGMKMVVVVLVFLVIPTFANNNVEITRANEPSSSSAPPLSSPLNESNKFKKCPKVLPEEKVERVLDHLHIAKFMKSALRKSAEFGSCVAERFCRCFRVKFEPLIAVCLAGVGLTCIKDAVEVGIYDCISACAKSIMNSNHNNLSEEAIGDFCYNKCVKGF